jgi:hypothetical protein
MVLVGSNGAYRSTSVLRRVLLGEPLGHVWAEAAEEIC